MLIPMFFDNDTAYTAWLQKNRDGFVFNFFGGTEAQGDMNVIHRADCRHLWRTSDEGRRTTAYAKVCSNSLDELVDFAVTERGFSWKFCGACNPKA